MKIFILWPWLALCATGILLLTQPGAVLASDKPQLEPPPSHFYTPVYAIQGTQKSSPVVGERVNTYGLVTGLTRNGFYLQDAVGDGDPESSDGVYVYTHSPPSVQTGQCVLVLDALVQEYYGKTELSWVDAIETASGCGADVIEPVALPTPRWGQDPAHEYERYEGMLVELDGISGVVHGPTKRYLSGEAEIALLHDSLQAVVEGGRILRVSEQDGADGDAWAGDTLYYLSSLIGGELPSVNWGDKLSSGMDGDAPVQAIMDYNFGKYQLLLTPGQTLKVDPRVVPPENGLAAAPDEFTICTLNVHGLGRGEAQLPDPQNYVDQLGRVAHQIAETLAGCTIIGLQETGAPSDAQNLAAHLGAEHGLPYRAASVAGPISSDSEFPLTNSLLVRADRVQIVDYYAVQGCSDKDYGVPMRDSDACHGHSYPLFNRPPLVADVVVTGDWYGQYPLRVVNNHWKSKAGDEEVNALRRLRQAQHVAHLNDEWFDLNPDGNLIVLGDLNDFVVSAPLSALSEDAEYPLVNAWDMLATGDRYSYIFNGVSQVLDHILLSPPMVQSVSGADAVHGNADAAGCGPGSKSAECQVSDHDALVVRIRPGGAASAGGSLGFAGVQVRIEQPSAGAVIETTTGADGEYRFWGLRPGTAQVAYNLPAWLRFEDSNSAATGTKTLIDGYNRISAPRLRFAAATTAAGAVSAVADAINNQHDGD